ncbi:hypothetical protein BDW59DRAFT_163662 [Aspergillus cavernicola]|uniref:Uncharacterized protein n=1 Tax=Aspergillus cavernicola TaxID=176166 RepID=A0ABR4I4J6_9EURO
MRFSALPWASLLSSAAHYVVAEVAGSNSTPVTDPITTPAPFLHDNIDLDIFVLTSPGVSTSTIGNGCNSRGATGYDCLTLSHDHVYTLTFTRDLVSTATGTISDANPVRTTDASEIESSDTGTAHPPTKTVGTLLTRTVHSNVRRKDVDLTKRGDDPDDPLPSDPLPSLGLGKWPTLKWMQETGKKLEAENKWLHHQRDNTVGQFFPFTRDKIATGVKGLYGCTSVIIASQKGVYLSHIFEDPVFIQRVDEAGEDYLPTSHEFFEHASIDALVYGGYPSIQPIDDLLGTLENPGPLHYLHQPKVFVVSPFEEGREGPLLYADRAQWLADEFQVYLYPPDSSPENAQPPTVIGYKLSKKQFAEMPESVEGKVIVEFVPIDHYEKTEGSDELRAIARWRLFANAREVAGWDFSIEPDDAPSCPVVTATSAECGGVSPTSPVSETATTATAAKYQMVRPVNRVPTRISNL